MQKEKTEVDIPELLLPLEICFSGKVFGGAAWGEKGGCGGGMILNPLNERLLLRAVWGKNPLAMVKRRKLRALHCKQTVIPLPAVPRRFSATGVFEMWLSTGFMWGQQRAHRSCDDFCRSRISLFKFTLLP
jgi:hypothetical protein